MRPIDKIEKPANLSQVRLIAIEGIDGSGKTTLAKTLQARMADSIHRRLTELNSSARDVHVVSPWQANDWTKAVRQFFVDGIGDARTEMLLTTACRRELVRTVIDPYMHEGDFVIVDRFTATTMAYQARTQDDLRVTLDLTRDFLYGTIPGLTIFLKVDYDQALSRAEARGQMDSIESRGPEFHNELNTKFKLAFAVMASISNAYAVEVDASKPADQVADDAFAIVETYLDLLFALNEDRDAAKKRLDELNIVTVEAS